MGAFFGLKRSGVAARALGFGVAVLLGVSACSGPPETPAQTSIPLGSPTPLASSPSSSPSGSPTDSPSPNNAYVPATSTSPAKNVPKPVLPALAKKKTFEGQKAFIKYWMETYNYAFDTGDGTLITQISDRGCVFCKATQDGAKKMYLDRKTWRIGGGATVTSIGQPTLVQPGISRFTIEVKDEPAQYFTASGPSSHYKPKIRKTASSYIWLEYSGGVWRTVDAGAKNA